MLKKIFSSNPPARTYAIVINFINNILQHERKKIYKIFHAHYEKTKI